MIYLYYINSVPKDFTGVCKISSNMSIRHYKNGFLHREDGPAEIYEDGDRCWHINGLKHREDGPAVEYKDGGKYWFYKGKNYGYDDDFTNETWKEKVENLKREEQLKIFI